MRTVEDIMKEIDHEYEIISRLNKVANVEVMIPTHLVDKVFPLLRKKYDDFQLKVGLTHCILKLWN